MTKRNYTLIELLTVIFIIVVLAGLIMPATSLVRARARRTECASNLKQVGSLCMQFSNDRDGQLPLYKVHKSKCYTIREKTIENAFRNKLHFSNMDKDDAKKMSTEEKSVLWTHGLVRYAKYNMSVFFCPSDERSLDLFTAGAASYSLNYGDADRPGGEEGASVFVKMTQVTRSPGGVILVGETEHGQLGMKSTDAFKKFFQNNVSNKEMSRKPHSSEYNTSFLDGHVETLSYTELDARNNKDGYKIK